MEENSRLVKTYEASSTTHELDIHVVVTFNLKLIGKILEPNSKEISLIR